MRCNNCGWNNMDTDHTCIKCGTFLDEANKRPKQEPSQSSQFGKTISDKDVLFVAEKNEKVFEETIQENINNSKSDIEKDILISCTNTINGYVCGYLNPGDAIICAKCKSVLSTAGNNVANDEDATMENRLPETINVLPQNASVLFNGTIDPYRKSAAPPICFLTRVLREGEKNYSPIPNSTINDILIDINKFEYDNEPIGLNRQNLDADNTTITSNVQAELKFVDGKWLLVDKSKLATTFIQVKTETELKEGDVILMGDRKFVFSTKTEPNQDQHYFN